MSFLDCYLAAEKPVDDKPFTVTLVETWYYIAVAMARNDGNIVANAERIYDAFQLHNDENERGATLKELKELSLISNGGLCIIPKTKDEFININDWR